MEEIRVPGLIHPNQQPWNEEIRVPDLVKWQERDWNAEQERSQNASWLSKSLIGIFGGSLAFNLLVLGFFVFFRAEAPDTDSYVTLLKEVATFHSTVFAPLLAFILGYYFSEGKRARSGD
ncbi:hypothetical protein [Longimicrobium terrae]|uniref:Uncharacterized protein n=1 Tax=Longimicrobium terrae TaxID=1639882 RepID=A0A841GX05_9BACT|nr:hypothetical protein [Longimicrobium terrae]MBB4635631.1 hypothetical protein [Longimicrobium terrae]MBB6070025.1 hypothetical protein [Longimicrobium terrae]NNC32932.1 hypothetical protein [Longimicrobium terrae]